MAKPSGGSGRRGIGSVPQTQAAWNRFYSKYGGYRVGKVYEYAGARYRATGFNEAMYEPEFVKVDSRGRRIGDSVYYVWNFTSTWRSRLANEGSRRNWHRLPEPTR